MEQNDRKMWMVRAGQKGNVLHHFLDQGIAYLGWGNSGVVQPETTVADLQRRIAADDPGLHPNAVGQAARKVYQFCQDIQVGDDIVTYDTGQRRYHIGRVESDAEYTDVTWVELATGGEFEEKGYVRRVAWDRTVPRGALSAPARNYLGRPPTLFALPAAVSEELRRHCE